MSNEYLKILSIYNKSNLKDIETKSGYTHWFSIILILYISIAVVTIFVVENKYKNFIIIFEGVVMFASLYLLSRKVKNKFVKLFNLEDDAFLKQNKLYWRGERALIFFEEVKKAKIEIESQTLIETINKELELKKFDILKMPFFVGAFTVLGMIFNSFFSKLDVPWLLFCMFIDFIAMYLYWSALAVLRTEESKMNDLKLFIFWYDLFGRSLIENRLKEQNS